MNKDLENSDYWNLRTTPRWAGSRPLAGRGCRGWSRGMDYESYWLGSRCWRHAPRSSDTFLCQGLINGSTPIRREIIIPAVNKIQSHLIHDMELNAWLECMISILGAIPYILCYAAPCCTMLCCAMLRSDAILALPLLVHRLRI
jgi:hypothetical protein